MLKVLVIANSNLSLSGIYDYFVKEGHAVFWGTFEQKVRDKLILQYRPEVVVYKSDLIKYDKNKKGNKYFYSSPGIPEKYFIEKISPDIVITDVSNRLAKVEKSKEFRVNVFHSFCFKKYVFHISNTDFDMLALPSMWWKEKFSHYVDSNKIKLAVTGYHKHDLIRDSCLKKIELKQKYGIPPEKPVVLYAPSWGGSGEIVWGNGIWPRWENSDKYLFFERFKKLVESKNSHLIVKLHHLVDGVDLDLIAEDSNVTVIRDYPDCFEDPHDYIAVSDLLVSDVSGIIIEFGILGKPIVIIEPDNSKVWDDPSIPRDYLPSEPISCFEEFLSSVELHLASFWNEKHSNPYSSRFKKLWIEPIQKNVVKKLYENIMEAFRKRNSITV